MTDMPEPQFLVNDRTWIISDTHFFHVNIGRYCDRPEDWHERIVDNWSSLIAPDETVFHVGDLALGKKENLEDLASLLNGRLYLMRGNHDRRGKAFYQRLGITLIPDPYEILHSSGLWLIFSHRPMLPLRPGALNLHGHIHNKLAPALGPRHVNLCVEVRGYRPWRLNEILTPYLPPLDEAFL